GGTINVITVPPSFNGHPGVALHGEFNAFGASADASGGANVQISVGTPRMSWIVGATGRRHNALRTGGGVDSHNVFHRYFGLNDSQTNELVGSRLQDTDFAQFGGHSKLSFHLPSDQSLTLWYQHSEQTGVRGYKDLLGGQGQLQSSFEPQSLNFLYARYEKLKVGSLDSLTGTFSVNSQRDGTVRQALRSSDTVTRDYTRVNSYGYAVQATSHVRNRQALVFGSEMYQEHIDSTRLQQIPETGQNTERRALYPNGSNYTTLGFFGQDSIDLVRGKLRAVVGGRITAVMFRTFEERNRDSFNRPLGVVDSSQSFSDVTFNSSLVWQVTPNFGLNLLVGRGFRAPNLNDLGAIGLNDLGYEVPAAEVSSAEALVGTDSGESALSTGKRAEKLQAEKLYNYELGFTVQTRRLYGRVHVFNAELLDPIVRRTLLFDANRIPGSIAGIPVLPIPPSPLQQQQGVVTVATAFDPRAVKAFVNDGQQRFYGLESLTQYNISSIWTIDANYTFLAGRDLNPNRPLRRLPPQQGMLSLRFTPGGSRLWLQVDGILAGPQERLSGGDLSDERIGAERRRRDIGDFFHGARVSPYLKTGTDGIAGTADDLLSLTNETLGQVQARVLPLGATVNGVRIIDDNTRVPLFLRTAGYFPLNLNAGFRLTEKSSLNLAVRNVLDTNYRVHGSGIDSPGINVYLGYNIQF
ncbi:MAG TPA: TonB-dependent receptor, partial [Terriglobia bacterium]|nr:TonB-dependent receptor [Terriglobia bacterium]